MYINLNFSVVIIFIFTLTFSFAFNNSICKINNIECKSNLLNNNIYNDNIKYISSSRLIDNCLLKENYLCYVKINKNLNISFIFNNNNNNNINKEILYKSYHLRGSNKAEFIPTSNIDELSLLIRFILLSSMIFMFIKFHSQLSFYNYFKTSTIPTLKKRIKKKQVTFQQFLSNDVINDIGNKKKELIMRNLSEKVSYLIKLRRLYKAKKFIDNNSNNRSEIIKKEIKYNNNNGYMNSDNGINSITTDAITTNDIVSVDNDEYDIFTIDPVELQLFNREKILFSIPINGEESYFKSPLSPPNEMK
jgi:hypothetical protein